MGGGGHILGAREEVNSIEDVHMDEKEDLGEEQDLGEEEDLGEKEEQEGELVELMDELEHGFDEPTLPRLTEEDVALDMDEMFLVDADGDLEAPSEEEEDSGGDENEFDL